MTLPRDPDLDAVSRALEALAAGAAPEPREIGEAREAIRRAAEGDHHRALLLARLALDRARRAMGVATDPRPAWRQTLEPAPRKDTRRGDLRARESGRFPDFEIDSEIPDGHPGKTAIEDSVASAFAGVRGRWRVAILVPPNAAWWGIRVEGAAVCWTGTLEGPEEQSPEFLSGRVREAVRLGLMQAALPHRRGRG